MLFWPPGAGHYGGWHLAARTGSVIILEPEYNRSRTVSLRLLTLYQRKAASEEALDEGVVNMGNAFFSLP